MFVHFFCHTFIDLIFRIFFKKIQAEWTEDEETLLPTEVKPS